MFGSGQKSCMHSNPCGFSCQEQSDQMSLWKNESQLIFSKSTHNYYRGKKVAKFFWYFCNFQKTIAPERRKFAQSGHLGHEFDRAAIINWLLDWNLHTFHLKLNGGLFLNFKLKSHLGTNFTSGLKKLIWVQNVFHGLKTSNSGTKFFPSSTAKKWK
jgi:hypothetical protein